MSDEIKQEDGPNRKFSTGAEKQTAEGKGTPVLVPGDAILDVAKHFENGASIYGTRNWEKGLPLSEILNSLERHLQQEKMGLIDEPHARALAWNAIVYLATKLRIEAGLLSSELADMPNYEIQDDYNAVEIDGPPKFQPGDEIMIKTTDPSILDVVKAFNNKGVYVKNTLRDSFCIFDHLVKIGDTEYYFTNDEIFPVKEG